MEVDAPTTEELINQDDPVEDVPETSDDAPEIDDTGSESETADPAQDEPLAEFDPEKYPEIKAQLEKVSIYEQLFGTTEEAKEVAEKAQVFDHLDRAVMTGDVATLLGAMHQTNPASVTQFAENFLPALQKGDQQLFQKVMTPVMSATLRNAMADAEKSGNQQLKYAAQHLSKWLFDNPEPPATQKRTASPEVEKATNEVRRMREELAERATGEIETQIHQDRVKHVIDNFDKNRALPQFARDAGIRKILEETNKLLDKDAAYQKVMDRLKREAVGAKFSNESVQKIRAAYINKFKMLEPAVRAQVVREAFGKKANGVPNPAKQIVGGGGVSKSRTPRAGEVDWSKTSTEDFLNDKVTLRK